MNSPLLSSSLKPLQCLLLSLCFLSLNACASDQASDSPLFQRATETKQANYFNHSDLPKESLVPGGIAILEFKYDGADSPEVLFQGNRVLVVQTDAKLWKAVIGLSLTLKPGEHHATFGEQKLSFTVKGKEYEAQYITIKNKSKVNPSEESLKRIRKESAAMRTAFKSWTSQAPSSIAMDAYPVEGPQSSQFGLKRFFNNQARRPHSGLDIAAPTGTEIKSPLPGKVAALGDYYFNGNTVLIDHGQGFVSMYCHMDTLSVKLGQEINAGDLLGTVGSTGRATGPHLHWSVNLNNTRVEPLLFMRNP